MKYLFPALDRRKPSCRTGRLVLVEIQQFIRNDKQAMAGKRDRTLASY